MPKQTKTPIRGRKIQRGKAADADLKSETINFRIAAADKAKLMRAAAKNDRSLTQFILSALQSRFQADTGKGGTEAKIKRSGRRARKDDKVLFLIPSATKARLRRSAKKADQNLSQYILDALFE